MDQQARLDAIITHIGSVFPLTAVPLAPEIAETSAFFKYLRVRCHNWTADRLSKVSGLRFGVSMPQMDALNVILYPTLDFDAPIFLVFCVLTRKRFIAHLNVCCPFDDTAYRATWVEPLARHREQYEPFHSEAAYPDWMLVDRNACSLHGAFDGDRLEDFTACTIGYLDRYLETLKHSPRMTDPARRARVSDFHARFKGDIRTRDRAQGMTARFIGKERARQIFFQVAT